MSRRTRKGTTLECYEVFERGPRKKGMKRSQGTPWVSVDTVKELPPPNERKGKKYIPRFIRNNRR